MPKNPRLFYLLFNLDGHEPNRRSGYNVSAGPKDNGGMWGKICLLVNGAIEEVKVNCRVYSDEIVMEVRPPEGVAGLTIEALSGGGFKLTAKR